MKNYEKYAKKIKEYKGSDFCKDFILPIILKKECCDIGASCVNCRMLQTIWLLEDYEEPEVDWSKVEVDTPILVRYSENLCWIKRHFAKYKNGKVYAWVDGGTSWTTVDYNNWKYAKLAETECEE